ncbi:SGNH hydrolase domain-containing protein [Paraburkholderia sp. GAS206C]|uniref:SGNH hydrolase domain-containing protein n=1 Tax=unclassified Paraburkholderia TaxID=2615204 RepID=UPI003D1DD876
MYERGQQIAAIASLAGNVIVVDPFKSLCTPKVCFTVKNDAALFSDTDHLSDAGVEYLIPGLTDAIKLAQNHEPQRID